MAQAPVHQRPPWLLPVIVLAQFSGTSLWFAGNAVMADLQQAFGLSSGSLGWLTSAVQLGFIAGTLVFAVLMIADRFPPSRVFLVSSLLAAGFNLGLASWQGGLSGVLAFRFLTGFFLAGIYPVGMKIAADWYAQDLGKALGFLVGALVLGTAFPHFLKFQGQQWDWRLLLQATSGLAAGGGLLLGLTVKNGPFRRRGKGFDPRGFIRVFRYPAFRTAAFAYFGHMWELYAFWAFLPLYIEFYLRQSGNSGSVSFFSFLVIALGALGCMVGGFIAQRQGSGRVVFFMLLGSGLCCLFSPWISSAPVPLFIGVMAFWGFVVVGDSPQCSTLVAQSAPAEYVGSALTMVNCLGFLITIFSIQLLSALLGRLPVSWLFLPLLVGPLTGLLSLVRHPSVLMKSGRI